MPPASRPSDSTFWAWSSWFCGHYAGVFEGLALDGVADRAQQPVRVDPALDEVVLRALLQGFDGQRLVVEAGQDDQRNVRRRGVGAPHGLEALGVGQSEVKQDDVDRALGEVLSRRRSCTRRASARCCASPAR